MRPSPDESHPPSTVRPAAAGLPGKINRGRMGFRDQDTAVLPAPAGRTVPVQDAFAGVDADCGQRRGRSIRRYQGRSRRQRAAVPQRRLLSKRSRGRILPTALPRGVRGLPHPSQQVGVSGIASRPLPSRIPDLRRRAAVRHGLTPSQYAKRPSERERQSSGSRTSARPTLPQRSLPRFDNGKTRTLHAAGSQVGSHHRPASSNIGQTKAFDPRGLIGMKPQPATPGHAEDLVRIEVWSYLDRRARR